MKTLTLTDEEYLFVRCMLNKEIDNRRVHLPEETTAYAKFELTPEPADEYLIPFRMTIDEAKAQFKKIGDALL